MHSIFVFIFGVLSAPFILAICLYLWWLTLPVKGTEIDSDPIRNYQKNSFIYNLILEKISFYLGLNLLVVDSSFKPNNPFSSDTSVVAENASPETQIQAGPKLDSFDLLSENSKDQEEKISGWLFIMIPKNNEKLALENVISLYASLRVYKLFSPEDPNCILDAKKSNFNNQSNLKKNSKHYFLCYAVLKGGNIFLYDSEKKNEGFGTIVLSEYTASLGFVDEFKESRAYSKKTPILLHRQDNLNISTGSSLTPDPNSANHAHKDQKIAYCLFTLQSTKKEDWYFAITSTILQINTDDISKLQRSCFSMEWAQVKNVLDYRFKDKKDSNAPTSASDIFLNALLGRLALGVMKTKAAHAFLKKKITKKFDSLQLPSVIDQIEVLNLSIGKNIPLLSETKLSSYGQNGQINLETFIDYSGGLTILLKVTAKLVNVKIPINFDLKVNRLRGSAVMSLKQPPSDRFWFGFKELPDIDLEIEPIFMQKKIKVKKIIDVLNSKILDSFKSSFVLPNMSDILFFIPGKKSKGGIFERDIHLDNFDLSNELVASFLSSSPILKTQKPDVDEQEVSNTDSNTLKSKLAAFLRKPQESQSNALTQDKEQNEIIQKIKLENSKKMASDRSKSSTWSFKSLIEVEKIPITPKNSLPVDIISPNSSTSKSKLYEIRGSESQNSQKPALPVRRDSNSIASSPNLNRAIYTTKSSDSFITPPGDNETGSFIPYVKSDKDIKYSDTQSLSSFGNDGKNPKESLHISSLSDNDENSPAPRIVPNEDLTGEEKEKENSPELVLEIPTAEGYTHGINHNSLRQSVSNDDKIFSFPSMSKTALSPPRERRLSKNYTSAAFEDPSLSDVQQLRLKQQQQQKRVQQQRTENLSKSDNAQSEPALTTKQIAQGIKTSVILSASELYKNAKQSAAAESAMKWIMKQSAKMSSSPANTAETSNSGVIPSEVDKRSRSGTNERVLPPLPKRQSLSTDGLNRTRNEETASLTSSPTLLAKESISEGFLIPSDNGAPPIMEPPKLPIRNAKMNGKTKVEDFQIY
ncbi:hypothetical protein AYI68_g6980 [Smittium mucronatum]|uniref:SMP-LTD domain-containing protein n=1 Tax=Smittium mucronatum TaxID=133383 RepID=A0A1R0GPZ3_9FUNG|nr:hypothetical protein AYI68_g6980 [Smittium mucronatum]